MARRGVAPQLTARKVFSKELPVMRFFTFVLTNAEPLPGLTCKNSNILQGFPAGEHRRRRKAPPVARPRGVNVRAERKSGHRSHEAPKHRTNINKRRTNERK